MIIEKEQYALFISFPNHNINIFLKPFIIPVKALRETPHIYF